MSFFAKLAGIFGRKPKQAAPVVTPPAPVKVVVPQPQPTAPKPGGLFDQKPVLKPTPLPEPKPIVVIDEPVKVVVPPDHPAAAGEATVVIPVAEVVVEKPPVIEAAKKLADVIRGISKYSGKYADYLAPLMIQHGIDTPLRQTHFLAQVGHESGEFRLVEEGLSYGPQAIKDNFRSRFIKADGSWDEAKIAEYSYKPEKFANYVYGSRMGNEGRQGAGYKHRGMGLMQVTGYNNQLAYSMWRYGDDRVIKNPEMLMDLEDACGSAVYYWINNGLNKWADKDDLLACGRLVNIGTTKTTKIPNGQAHRKKLYDRIKPKLVTQ